MKKKVGTLADADIHAFSMLGMEERSLVAMIGEKEVEKNMAMDRLRQVIHQRQEIVQRNIPEGTVAQRVTVDAEGQIFSETDDSQS